MVLRGRDGRDPLDNTMQQNACNTCVKERIAQHCEGAGKLENSRDGHMRSLMNNSHVRTFDSHYSGHFRKPYSNGTIMRRCTLSRVLPTC